MNGIRIVNTGSYVPDRVVTNNDLAKLVETDDEWIYSRTGIRQRHLSDGENTTDFCVKAAEKALEGLDRRKIGFVIVATFTPETFVPSTACMLQSRLQLPEDCMTFDVNTACTGFLYALQLARVLLTQRPDRYALVLGAELLSKVTDFTDRSTCVLFGDAAGAAVLEAAPDRNAWFVCGARGNREVLRCNALPLAGQTQKEPYVFMNGREVFKFAVEIIPECLHSLCEQSGISPESIDWFLCHQANARIISHVYRQLKLPAERFFMNLEKYGNTSAASIAVALDEMNRKGMLTEGRKLAVVGFGGGLTWGGMLLEL